MTATDLTVGDQVMVGRTPATIVSVSTAGRFVRVRYANGSPQWVNRNDVRRSKALDNLLQKGNIPLNNVKGGM